MSQLIGQTILGRYRFDAQVGEGTFARVFRVHDLRRNVDLAAKVLRQDIALEPTFVERFKREAEVLARLQHPHIVRYYETVETSDGMVFILMDYIPGTNLQHYMRHMGGTFSVPHALKFVRPITAALTYAHEEGIIHRDIKPANILIDENGQVYLTDFGIARLINEASTLTQDTAVGTPLYMSPEQLTADDITLATDVYALGVVLFQMLVGKPPFIGESPDAQGTTASDRVAYEHLRIAPPHPRNLNPALPSTVQAAILRCLQKKPTDRFPSAVAVYEALADTLDGAPADVDVNDLVKNHPPPPPEWSRIETAPPPPGGVSASQRPTIPHPNLDALQPMAPVQPSYPRPRPRPPSRPQARSKGNRAVMVGGIVALLLAIIIATGAILVLLLGLF